VIVAELLVGQQRRYNQVVLEQPGTVGVHVERAPLGGKGPARPPLELMDVPASRAGAERMKLVRRLPGSNQPIDCRYHPSSELVEHPTHGGFVYLAVVLDWFSCRVLSWRVSIVDGLKCRNLVLVCRDRF
jgi:hypothetical protein